LAGGIVKVGQVQDRDQTTKGQALHARLADHRVFADLASVAGDDQRLVDHGRLQRLDHVHGPADGAEYGQLVGAEVIAADDGAPEGQRLLGKALRLANCREDGVHPCLQSRLRRFYDVSNATSAPLRSFAVRRHSLRHPPVLVAAFIDGRRALP
jgi:hypothetical protein